MKITREDVLHVAELAHLELTEAEVDKFRKQLDDILVYIDKLKELDVSDVEPMAQALQEQSTHSATLRDDVVCSSNIAQAILEQAPHAKSPYFRVPKVIER